MTRPAVIIGLGGTGQWVTTYVKKELLEDNNGKMPKNVRLLCFDTWPDANVGGATAIAPDVVSIGNTKLERNVEFIPLSGDTYPKGEDVIGNRAAHIGQRISDMGEAYSWFDAPYYRNNTPRATWELSVGAGMIRQFGRLGFFNHATAIQQQLIRAFTEVHNANPGNDNTQVMVIASFAGGTGAGMLLDLAAMARSLSSRLGTGGSMFRGIFVLPGAFLLTDQHGAQAMNARAYAAWRELARFMNLGPDYGAHTIKYNDDTTIEVKDKPFDQVFLVDANRKKHAFTNTKPENGVFPSVATFISTSLDDDSGAQLGDAINKIQDTYKRGIGFSTFGAYAIQLPISHAINEYALQTERDLLLRWLAPQVEIKDGKEVINRLQADQNLQKPGERGSQELKPFMTSQRHKLDAVINRSTPNQPNPTNILENAPVLAAIYERYEAFTTGRYRGKVEEDAQGGYCAPDASRKVNANSWLGRLLLPGDHDKTHILGLDGRPMSVDPARLESEVNSTTRGTVPTSRDQDTDPTEDEADRIIKGIENDQNGYIVKHYGVTGGRGAFDEELDKLVEFNAARFKQLLEIELLNLLNGTIDDEYRGFSGRLGYVEDYFKSLMGALEWFKAEHLRDVKSLRGTSNFEGSAKAIMDGARDEMAANAGKKCMVFFNHPRAHNKQEEFLEAAQNYCETLKDEKLLFALEKLTGRMKDAVSQASEQVRKWADTLILAPNSLYAQVLDEYIRTKTDLDGQARVNQSQKLQVLRNYPTDYTQSADVLQRINKQLKRLRWKTSIEGTLAVMCEAFVDGEFRPFLVNNDSHGHNKKLMMSIGRLAWENFGEAHILLEEIGLPGSSSYRDPEELAIEIIAHSEPMFTSPDSGPGVKSAMRRASSYTNLQDYDPATYVAQIDGKAPTIDPPLSTNGYIKSNSANYHKLAFIQWIDGLRAEHFTAFAILRSSYNKLIQSGDSHERASRLHIFPADGNAAFYEHQLPLWLNKSIRELSPRVVLLMTEVEKVRWFFQCYALGFILHGRYSDGTDGRWWRLLTPGTPTVQPQDVQFYRSMDNADPDPFDVINSFIKGVDGLTTRPIVWDAVRLIVNQTKLRLKTQGLKDLVDAQFAPQLGTLPAWSYADRSAQLDEPRRLIHHLENKGQDYFNAYVQAHGAPEYNPGWAWVRHEDYKDLADIGRMMYIETLLLEELIKTSHLPNSHYRG